MGRVGRHKYGNRQIGNPDLCTYNWGRGMSMPGKHCVISSCTF